MVQIYDLSDHLPICCDLNLSISSDQSFLNKMNLKQKFFYKNRWDKADLLSYYIISGQLLQNNDISFDALHDCKPGCHVSDHFVLIDNYYNFIINALSSAAASCVPRIPHKSLKPFWDDELDSLKESSIDMHRLWILCGRPRHGTLNNARLNAKLLYKNAVKRAALDFEQQNADEIGNYLLHKDSIQFWKCWNSRYQKKP